MAKRCRVSLSDPLLERSEGMPLSDRERAEGVHQHWRDVLRRLYGV